MPKPDVDVGNFNLAGLADVLTMRMPHMKVVIDAMKERGLRDDHFVLVGGAPLNEEFASCLIRERREARA